MSRRASQIARILATALLIACGGGGSAPAQAADGQLDLALAVDGRGRCTFHWQNAPVDASGLSAAVSTTMSQSVAGQSGAAEVVERPPVSIRGAETIPYRCLGGALHALQRGGVSRVRLLLPVQASNGDSPFVLLELPQATAAPPPPVQPWKNDIAVTATGQILWNRRSIDLLHLRQYLDITVNITPAPDAHFKPAPQARLQDVGAVFEIMHRSNLEALVLFGTDLRTGQPFEMMVGIPREGSWLPPAPVRRLESRLARSSQAPL